MNEMPFSSLLLLTGLLSFSTPALATRLEDRTTAPTRSVGEVETVAKFDTPPGHATISRGGRIFMDAGIFDPAATIRVFERQNDGKMLPFPSPEYQKKFKTIHGIYVDAHDRLWILDNGKYGFARAPRLFGYDIQTGREIENYSFPASVAGIGSMINDIVVDPVREMAFISDTSPIAGKSSIVVFDIKKHSSRRILRDHISVRAANNLIYVESKPFTVIGLFRPKFGIDGIALDPTFTWVYYAAFNRGELYRIPVAAAVDAALSEADLERSVEKVSDITMTDGILVDERHSVYLSDVEHSAVVRASADGRLETLFKDPRFRWPTGYTRAPDGWIYFTCNAIHQITLQSREKILELGPYFLFRFRP